MSPLALAISSGALVGLALAVLVVRLLPAHVDLAEAIGRVTPARHPGRATSTEAAGTPSDSTERLGAWAARTLPSAVWARTPRRELALLQIPLARFYGEKVQFAVVGLLMPQVIAACATVAGLPVAAVVPVGAGLLLAVILFFTPNYNAHTGATALRGEFRVALAAFADLVALERAAGSGVRQAMENAARATDTRVFARLAEELARSRWSGLPPWDALAGLADELGLPELHDIADVLRLSGAEGSAAYQALAARSAGLRSAILNDDLARANGLGEQLAIPGSLLGAVFIVLVMAPFLLRMAAST
ncbi:type II secretion system F family protein [Antribacter gilvus]|uniref:type II secretion system F family protein n=1 Tax=Antribacter gilvus TaxID=2304675 RepID=UPI000F793870|nr:type II secretion system F family protein [Antribacter gilvus]